MTLTRSQPQPRGLCPLTFRKSELSVDSRPTIGPFVKDFAKLAKPLHNLTRKNATFVWNQECEDAFQALKEQLMSAPILVPPRDEGQYVLDTDASDKIQLWARFCNRSKTDSFV